MDLVRLTIKILFVHNRYKSEGGEDTVLQSEQDVLFSNGHVHSLYLASNHDITGWITRLKTAINVVYSNEITKNKLYGFKTDSYDIVHVHNFFPIITPAIYDVCIDADVPVIQTLHNYRTICTGALLLRNGKICEKCINGSPYYAILYRCYRNSIAGSWAVARMVAYHRKRSTWHNKVDRFIALTQFAKQKFVSAGFPEKKIIVKPNFYNEDPEIRNQKAGVRHGALFVGRLSREKGVATLLSAWRAVNISLRIAGDGPSLNSHTEKKIPFVEFLGRLNTQQVSVEMQNASFLIMPSEWYEGFPMVLAEAFAHGLPVISSRLGSMAEIVEDGVTGLHFEAGNPKDLAEKVMWMHNHPIACRKMGENARREYEKKYTPERNYKMLMDIYMQAIEEKRAIRNKSI